MWFFGVLAGLIFGAMAESFAAALFLAAVGGVGVHLATRSKDAPKRVDSSGPVPMREPPPKNELADLRRKIVDLEQRLQRVETQLAQGFAEPVSLAGTHAEPADEPVTAGLVSTVVDTPDESVAAKTSYNVTIADPNHLDYSAVELATPEETAIPERLAGETIVQPVPVAPKTILVIDSNTPAPNSPPLHQARAEPAKPVIPLKDRLPAPISNLLYGGNTLVKMGVLILFLGLAFLLRYTAERVSVPIELRYAGVALIGAGVLALGWFLRRRRADYALVLQGMGIGVFYLTILAAMRFHALMPSQMGFGFMFAVSILGATLAILQNSPTLAVIAALEGFATPMLTATGGNHMLGLFTYLTILDLGIVLIAWFNAWRVLNVIGFVGTFVLASGWASENYSSDQYAPVQAFLILFFLLFTAVGVFFARRTLLESKLALQASDALGQQARSTLSQVGRVDSALVFGTPLTAFGMQYLLSKPWEFGPAFSALALSGFYLLLAKAVFSRERRGLALLAEAYAIMGVILATLAIPLGFEGLWTGAAWAVEGAGMYWLGVRQNRPYSRAFAYLVMIGASYKLLQATQLNPAADGPLLLGSTIGPVLLAVSTLAVWWQHRQAGGDAESRWEDIPGQLVLWLGMAALTLLPWQWFSPPMAAAASAALSVVAYFAARRFEVGGFGGIVGALQALSVFSFIATVHRAADTHANAALESGVWGMFAALTIAASILLTAGWNLAQARRTARDKGLPPDWSAANSVAVVVGTSLLHLAMLYAVSLEQAAMIWPITSCAVLWVALKLSHGPLAALAAGLQLVSVGLYGFASSRPAGPELAAFAHAGFWSPAVFGLAAWRCADWIRAEAKQSLDSLHDDAPGSAAPDLPPVRGFSPWCTQTGALWLPVFWGLGWWLMAWLDESRRVLEMNARPEYLTAAAIAIILATSIGITALARWRDWKPMGVASLFTLPALALCAYAGIADSAGLGFVPSAYLGAYLWPLALAWHLCLLRIQSRWTLVGVRATLHIVGFWFFLLLGSREAQIRFSDFGDPASSWSVLGWVLVPALAFWLLRSSLLRRRWPLTEFRHAYLGIACVPVAAYLLAWCFVSNLLSPGNASPLPYVPILNPLELAQWLVLAALLLWWRALPDNFAAKLSERSAMVIGALIGWFLLTAMVLRSCHHWAGVAWEASALFDSTLTQAALSITWSIMAVLVMLLGNRRVSRTVWLAGAFLLAVVVVKLFVVELADRGGLYRIVSFIGVGVLLLVVGYFAPVPVKTPSQPDHGPAVGPDLSPTQTSKDDA